MKVRLNSKIFSAWSVNTRVVISRITSHVSHLTYHISRITSHVSHLNIRSIRHKLNYSFDNFNDFEVLCFTQTLLDTQIEDSFLLNQCSDVTLYRKDVSFLARGVALYVRNSVYSRRRLDLELKTIQSIWLELSYKSTSILVYTVYRPPKCPVSFWDDLSIERALDTRSDLPFPFAYCIAPYKYLH